MQGYLRATPATTLQPCAWGSHPAQPGRTYSLLGTRIRFLHLSRHAACCHIARCGGGDAVLLLQRRCLLQGVELQAVTRHAAQLLRWR